MYVGKVNVKWASFYLYEQFINYDIMIFVPSTFTHQWSKSITWLSLYITKFNKKGIARLTKFKSNNTKINNRMSWFYLWKIKKIQYQWVYLHNNCLIKSSIQEYIPSVAKWVTSKLLNTQCRIIISEFVADISLHNLDGLHLQRIHWRWISLECKGAWK